MHILHSWRTRLATAATFATTLVMSFALFGNAPSVYAQDSQWVHSFTSSQDIELTAMSVSDFDEVVIAGTFHGTVDFDPGAGETLLSSGMDDTSFIARYTPSGALIWAYRLIGNGDVRINDIVVDPMSQIGVVGSFEGSADLDPGTGVFQATSEGGHDIFLLRLLPDGNMQWGWAGGDTNDDIGYAIATDYRSALYITGKYEGKIFFQSGNSLTYEHRSIGGSDVFVARFNNAGDLFWVRTFGGDEDDAGSDLSLDAADNVFVVGSFADEVDLDPLHTSFELRSRGSDDIFVSVLTVIGNYLGSTQLGGTRLEGNAQVFAEADGSFYVTGEFEGSANFDRVGAGGVLESRGGRDIFLTRYGPGATRNFQWAFAIGSEQSETLGGIVQDGFGSVYLMGSYGGSVDFDPAAATETNLTSSGAADIFVAKYSRQGQLRSVQGMTNPQDDRARAIAISSSSNVLIGGEYSGAIDLGSGLSASTNQPAGVFGVFVAQYARDTWTFLPERAYLPGIRSGTAAR